jgi:hypothetical protein
MKLLIIAGAGIGAAFRARPARAATPNQRWEGCEGDLGGPISKVCGDVLHFLHEGGFCVSKSQRRKDCRAKPGPCSTKQK